MVANKNKYILDTNICISLLKNKYGIREKVLDVKAENCFVSEITIAELYYGASKSNNKEERIKDVSYIASIFQVIPVYESLELYGDIKAELERGGTPLDDFDILIGSSAIYRNFIMVTDNVKHLNKLPGIRIQNWVKR
ncbi:type II toxin-antitoxin system VapC family toxin [Parabacteroides sp. AF48-14]|uniref:type II toxin-antitoxin system VapC family toxin n=1 Tax=Parabacteroides sp. AF48-14 TaxID=2292052 RepID=UPI000EFF2FB5|nr:type II toxin-antitoxin system VapC family toxin [Parabacteroides sp. AF48-14]RHO65855.1 type II toxin-antitoxin system VapC family toxin [Parabacteroides sp. AF48-14]